MRAIIFAFLLTFSLWGASGCKRETGAIHWTVEIEKYERDG